MDNLGQLDSLIHKFDKPFSVEDFYIKNQNKTDLSKREIEDILFDSKLVFRCNEDTSFTSRQSFFDQSEFFIKPTEMEIKGKYLIPGHRFIPFYPLDELFPSESFRILGRKGYIPVKSEKFQLKNLYKFYYLLGADNISDSFIADDSKNEELLGKSDNKITVSVFDMSDFFKSENFVLGDLLRFKVNDWAKGEFTVTKGKKSNQTETDDFIEKFEESLGIVFEKFGHWIEIPDQLAYAYYYLTEKYTHNPIIPITDFVSKSTSIEVKHIEDTTILWTKQLEENSDSENSIISISESNNSSINEILSEISDFMTSIEVEAFLRDRVNSVDSEDAKLSASELFPPLKFLQFTDKAQKTIFKNLLEEAIEENYQHISHSNPGFEIRSKILEELNEFYTLYNQLSDDKLEQHKDQIDAIKQYAIMLRQILHQVNTNFYHDDEYEIERLDSQTFALIKQFRESVNYLNLKNKVLYQTAKGC